jgi:RHS repeat-associated protein
VARDLCLRRCKSSHPNSTERPDGQLHLQHPRSHRDDHYPGGRSITDSADLRSRLLRIDDPFSPAPIAQYSYDPGNRILQRDYRNGTTAAYTYNSNDWITTVQHNSGINPIAGFAYAYDNEGNKKCEQNLQDTSHSEAYQYDNIYRLMNFQVGSSPACSTIPLPTTQTEYTLDPLGNWPNKVTNGITESRTHNAVNEITTITIDGGPPCSLSYDNNGNLTTDCTYNYRYDEENRLTTVIRISDSAAVGQYQYDGLSRRVQKVASLTGTPTTTRYFYDDARIVEEQDASGTTQATYVYGNAIDEVLAMDRTGQTYYYHQNALGSTEAITDSTASVVERDAYDAYGSPTALPSAIGNPYLFTGRQLDAETGIYFYRARYYDPGKGRFLQRDPLEYVSSMNLYEYARSNPINRSDAFGLQPSIQELLRAFELYKDQINEALEINTLHKNRDVIACDEGEPCLLTLYKLLHNVKSFALRAEEQNGYYQTLVRSINFDPPDVNDRIALRDAVGRYEGHQIALAEQQRVIENCAAIFARAYAEGRCGRCPILPILGSVTARALHKILERIFPPGAPSPPVLVVPLNPPADPAWPDLRIPEPRPLTSGEKWAIVGGVVVVSIAITVLFPPSAVRYAFGIP